MAKRGRGRPRKVKPETKHVEEVIDEAKEVYGEGSPVLSEVVEISPTTTESENSAVLISIDASAPETDYKPVLADDGSAAREIDKGIKVVFQEGKYPVFAFKGQIHGKDIAEPFLYKLNRAYRHYRKRMNQNVAQGISEDVIVVDMNVLRVP